MLFYKEHKKEISGGEPETTNNRMELQAAISALNMLKEPCEVMLYTDSAYLCNAFKEGWIDNWQRNGWHNVKKQPVENQDLWQQLLRLSHLHQIQWNKVKGHSTNQWNNRCDELARGAIKSMKKGASFT